MDDHDLLIEISTGMKFIKKQFDNHLQHHWMITMTALAAALSSMGAVIIFLIVGR